ncbi:uncharacterized protein LOC110625148 isoform X2 [Manihot esculenta]|uniref:Uncharacterized protein n=1 Tax=Manihot esculenta TaxID=3983 RepID=A0A2C9V5A0_MANES|nr:uncharacterized protein LOC110625148 isoform X2 [Manihot esculenta]OAY39013.1 hypothetical protein MANES_10G060700v8 [Manihot esculenta]
MSLKIMACCTTESCAFRARKLVSDDILPHILNLYGSRAIPRDFEIYAPNASFEDPLMCAHGVKQIKSAFYSLPKILVDNKQQYIFLGRSINIVSLIKLYVEDGKVLRHEDWWDKKPISNRHTSTCPLFGRFKELSRRGSMLATHAMMRFGKDPRPK